MDWHEGEQSGMAPSNAQTSLFLCSFGPKRTTSHTPAVIVLHGLGGTYLEWLPTMKLLSRFARCYLYERAGYHPSSSPASSPRTPANIVAELKTLLARQGILPPYILLGHSYGGILVRQFIADSSGAAAEEDLIAGAVIVDSTPDQIPDFPEDWPTLLGDDASYESVVGLEGHHCFPSDEDFRAVMRATARNEGPGSIAEEEFANRRAQELITRLRARGQALGDKPLSVIMCDMSHDFFKIYAHGVKHGNGSRAAREALAKRLEHWAEDDEAAMRTLLDLSSNRRFVKATGRARTHNCHMVEPRLVVGEVEWVYRQHMEREG